MKCFSRADQDREETEVRQRAWGGLLLVPLMTLPVKVCRATSATVIRGPASHRGRESPLCFLRFRFKEIAKMFRSQHFWLQGKDVIFWCHYISDENGQLLSPGEVFSLRMKLVWITESPMRKTSRAASQHWQIAIKIRLLENASFIIYWIQQMSLLV